MVLRRLRIGVMDVKVAMECLPTIVELMKTELGWDAIRCIEVSNKGIDTIIGS